jgi:hypothetical protein
VNITRRSSVATIAVVGFSAPLSAFSNSSRERPSSASATAGSTSGRASSLIAVGLHRIGYDQRAQRGDGMRRSMSPAGAGWDALQHAERSL